MLLEVPVTTRPQWTIPVSTTMTNFSRLLSMFRDLLVIETLDVQSLFFRTYPVLENDDNLFGLVDSSSKFQYGYRLSRFRAHIALDITVTEL